MRIESCYSVVSSPLPHPCPDTRRKLSRHLQIGGEPGSENKPDAHCICQAWCGSYFDVVKILGEMNRFRVPRLLFKMMHKQLCSQMILCCTRVSCSLVSAAPLRPVFAVEYNSLPSAAKYLHSY